MSKNQLECDMENFEGVYDIFDIVNGTGTRKQYYPCGQLQLEWHYKDGKYHGLCYGYDVGGKVKYADSFKYGDRHGAWEEFVDGEIKDVSYSIYGEHASEKSWRENQLIEQLSGIESE